MVEREYRKKREIKKERKKEKGVMGISWYKAKLFYQRFP